MLAGQKQEKGEKHRRYDVFRPLKIAGLQTEARLLAEILPEELFHSVKGNLVRLVIQVGMCGSGNNQQLLVVALQQLERILAHIAAVGLLAMNNEHGTP